MDEEQEVDVLLLGDADVGKTVFLSVLIRRLHTRSNVLAPDIPLLRHEDQPYVLELSRPNRSRVRINFYDTGSPTSYATLRPHMIIICFDTQNRASLQSAYKRWKYEVETHFNYSESLPVMLLGLKRDEVNAGSGQSSKGDVVPPFEALNVAQEMRLDMYAECSALTGQTLTQACEDVIKMAVRCTKAEGGREPAHYCLVM